MVRLLTDSSSIANAFNRYFAEAPVGISSTLPQNHFNCNNHMTGNQPNSFFLIATTPLIISNLFHDIKSSNNGGLFDISRKIVKSADDLFAEPLAHIFNRCIIEGYFPDRLKFAPGCSDIQVGRFYKTQQFQANFNFNSFVAKFSKKLYAQKYRIIFTLSKYQ